VNNQTTPPNIHIVAFSRVQQPAAHVNKHFLFFFPPRPPTLGLSFDPALHLQV